MAPLRGEANRPIGNNGRSRKIPKHRNELPAWEGPIPAGDEHNIRGLAAAGSRLGGAIRGTRPDTNL